MKRIVAILSVVFAYLIIPSVAFAATSSVITDYTNNTLQLITVIASALAVFFLVKGGYLYITSAGNPQSLENAKKTIKNSIIGLLLVLGAHVIVSTLTASLAGTVSNTTTVAIPLSPIETVKPNDGLTQVLIDAISGVLQNIVQSATKPIIDGIITYLTTTPSLLSNSVVFNFWLVIVGITDSLFIVVVALLGLHVMSAESLGFEQVEIRTLLPKIGFAFLGANVSLFLADYVITTCNALVKAVIDSTGGIAQAWIVNAITLPTLSSGQTFSLITLLFLILFLILAIVLLFMYIGRLIFIALAGVLAPLIFLLWVLPKFSDFAEIAVKTYIVTVFVIFVHVIVIQLAASFLAIPANNQNSLLAIAVAIGLFFTLLKIPGMMYQMVFYSSGLRSFRQLGGQIINVISSSNSSSATRSEAASGAVKLARKRVMA